MPITREQYSRKASMGVRDAMALALARHFAALTFHQRSGAFQFAEVFDEWPSSLNRYVPPSACVLPTGWKYADALMTPTLCEDTWEVPGEPGFGLYKLSEAEVDFEVSLRTTNTLERGAIILGVEESFRAPRLLMDDAAGPRNAVVVPLPEYYGVPSRFALTAARVIDDEERAMREQRDAVFTISGQAPQVTVGPVFPLDLRIRQVTC